MMRWKRKSLRADSHVALVLAAGGFCAAVVAILLSRLDVSADVLKLCLQISVPVAAVALMLAALFIYRILDDRRQIAESEQRFRRAMEDSAIGIAIVGLDGRIQETNPAFAAMLGYSKAEIEALTFFRSAHRRDG